MARGELAIAIPCLNEAKNLEVLLPQLQETIRHFAIPARLYVIDGGSQDNTAEVAKRFGATPIRQRGTGYGGAIRTAIEDLDSEYLLTLDGDCSHPPALVNYLYQARADADIVIASRYIPQGYARMSWPRLVLSRALNKAFRYLLDLPIHDLSSGYRLYNRGAVAKLTLEMSTYAILQEILIKAYCDGYVIKEIPMHFFPRAHGQSHARLVSLAVDYLKTFRAMWRLRNGVASADYDSRAFFSRIPLQRYWQRRRYSIILEYVGRALRVLDAGCGSTQLLNGLPHMVGMDPQLRKLRFMRTPGRRLVSGSTFALPFRSEAFDAVISSQVIEHLAFDDTIFEELARCVAPGGHLILGTVDYGSWQWPLIERIYGLVKPTGYADEHITHYTREGLFERLARMGFEVQDHQYILGGEIIVKARKPSPASGRSLTGTRRS